MLFEFEEGGSRKFYRIERNGTRVHLHWGRIGTDGRRKVRELPTEAEAIALYDAETYRRKTRGYRIVLNEALPHDEGAARLAAERDMLAAAAPLTTAPRFMFVHRARAQFVWLERHDAEVRSANGEFGREAAAVPTAVAFADARAAERAFERRTATLLREGFDLAAFDAKPMPKAKPPKSTKLTKSAAKPAKKSKVPFVGERWAFFGEFASWPSYHGGEPSDVAQRRGAKIVHEIGEADVVVIGDLRGTGRSEAKKKAEKLAAGGLRVLDEAAFRELVRIDLAGKKFTFIGGFDCSPAGLEDGVLARMVERAGAAVHPEVDAELDYLVIGNHRGPRKVALQNVADKLIEGGAKLVKLDETAFLELVRIEKPAGGDGTLDFAGFLSQLYGHVDQKKLGRALTMLREQRFELYTKIEDDHLIGVVRSQSDESSVYASWVTHEGRFGCSQTSLEDCMGLQGTTCKHLLVLVVGLARTNQLPMQRALDWMRASHARGPVSNTTLTAETFIQYKGATAGEIDWRPTETIPEDFYAV